MKLYSTNDKTNIVNLEKATLRSLPDDNGLYLPLSIPELEKDFINNLSNYSFPEIAFEISRKIIGTEIPTNILEQICFNAINFPAPLLQPKDGECTPRQPVLLFSPDGADRKRSRRTRRHRPAPPRRRQSFASKRCCRAQEAPTNPYSKPLFPQPPQILPRMICRSPPAKPAAFPAIPAS